MPELDLLRELSGELHPPPYDDLVAVSRTRRRRAALGAATAVATAVIVAVASVALIGSDGGAQRPEPAPSPVSPTPTPDESRTQSAATWADTEVEPASKQFGWVVEDPLADDRLAWFDVLADHLDPGGDRLEPDRYGGFIVPIPGPGGFNEFGSAEVLLDRSVLADGCRDIVQLRSDTEPCTQQSFTGPHGERAWAYRTPCCGWDEVSPTPTSDTYTLVVAVERDDGTIGFVSESWRGPDANPYSRDVVAAAAADPRLTLPAAAFDVPRNSEVTAVTQDHLPGYRSENWWSDALGVGHAAGKLGTAGLSVTVRPAAGTPRCGGTELRTCVERRVFGADDPTTVYVGRWDHAERGLGTLWGFVLVGDRNSVVVETNHTHPGQRLQEDIVDLLLDPRLQ